MPRSEAYRGHYVIPSSSEESIWFVAVNKIDFSLSSKIDIVSLSALTKLN